MLSAAMLYCDSPSPRLPTVFVPVCNTVTPFLPLFARQVFGPAFRRNARWSSDKAPVPDHGDMNTPWAEVDKFYNFWYTFKYVREALKEGGGLWEFLVGLQVRV